MSAIEVAREGLDSWNAGDRERHRGNWTEDAVLREHATGREVHGADAITDVHFAWREAFPDGHGEVVEALDAGDVAVMRVVWTGTQTGPMATPDGQVVPPTGQSFRVPACLVMRVRDGRVVAQDHYFDLMTLLVQLGVMPVPAA